MKTPMDVLPKPLKFQRMWCIHKEIRGVIEKSLTKEMEGYLMKRIVVKLQSSKLCLGCGTKIIL